MRLGQNHRDFLLCYDGLMSDQPGPEGGLAVVKRYRLW